MDTELFVVLSCALSFGAPLAFAARELVLLRRGGDGGSWRREKAPDAPPPPPAPVGNKPLPDCLVPKPLPIAAARSRVLEDA